MVFCRGCAKQISETAFVCPYCNAKQGLPANSKEPRNVVTLILVSLGWTLILWIGFVFAGSIIIGVVNHEYIARAQQLGREFSEAVAVPALLISGCVSALLTNLGVLPGSSKK